MHSRAFQCIQQNFIAFHFDAFLICCMLTHSFAFRRIHVGCILVRCIYVHLPALHLLHHTAFSIWCIYMHYHASIIRCISILCCIIMHLVHVIHSWALPYVCILNMMHISAFRCMLMRCILMHSNYDAFMCINSYSSSRKGSMPDLDAPRAARWAWYLLHDCFMMRVNAKKYPNMREYAHRLVDHTNIHKRSRADSRLNSHGSMQHGPDGLQTGWVEMKCIWRCETCECIKMQLYKNAPESTCITIRVNAPRQECIKMHLWTMRQNASKYSTLRMHHVTNAPTWSGLWECIIMR